MASTDDIKKADTHCLDNEAESVLKMKSVQAQCVVYVQCKEWRICTSTMGVEMTTLGRPGAFASYAFRNELWRRKGNKHTTFVLF
jgi:hypothetical protein